MWLAPDDATLTNGNVQLYVGSLVVASGAQFILIMINNIEFVQFLAKKKLIFLTNGTVWRGQE